MATCVYRKLRFERIGDAGCRPGHAIRCVRCAEPGARRAHPCLRSGAFSRCCNNSHKILGLGALKATTWSTHSRRIVPINLSAKQFCHGAPGAMGLSRIPMAYSARDGSTVDPVAIADEVAWGLIPGEGFNNLLPDPFCRRVRGHIDPDKLSPSQPDNDQPSLDHVLRDARLSDLKAELVSAPVLGGLHHHYCRI
jgi:hypothetical protein